MDFLPDIEKFKNFFDGTDSKNEISIAVEEAKKYDIFNLISRVSALNLFHQNQTKSVILDTYIEGLLCQTRDQFPSKYTISSGKFRKIINQISDTSLKYSIDPPENMFVQNVMFYGNYRVLNGIDQTPAYNLQHMISVLFAKGIEYPKEFLDATYILVNGMLEISEKIVGGILNTENNHDTDEEKGIMIPSAMELNKYTELVITNGADFRKLFLNRIELLDLVTIEFGVQFEGDFDNKSFYTRPFLYNEEKDQYILLNAGLLPTAIVFWITCLAKKYGIFEEVLENYNDYIFHECQKYLCNLGHKKVLESQMGIDLFSSSGYKEYIASVQNNQLVIVQYLYDDGKNYNACTLHSTIEKKEFNDVVSKRLSYHYSKIIEYGVEKEDIFVIIIINSLGRGMAYGIKKYDYCYPPLRIHPFELMCISINEKAESVFIPRYLKAKNNFQTFETGILSELNQIEIYCNNNYSFYMNDEFAPGEVTTYFAPGDSLDYIIRAIQKEDRRLVEDAYGTRFVEVVLNDEKRKIYVDPNCAKSHEIRYYIEFKTFNIWIVAKEISNVRKIDLCYSLVDLISYWLSECRIVLDQIDGCGHTYEIQILLSDGADQYYYYKENPKSFSETLEISNLFPVMEICVSPEAFQYLNYCDNSREKELIAIIIDHICKLVGKIDKINYDLNALFPNPIQKKIFSLDYQEYHYFEPTENRENHFVHDEDEDILLNEIGEEILEVENWNIGIVDDEDRTKIVHEVVGILYKKLQQEVSVLSSRNLIEVLYDDLEKVLFKLMLSQKRYAEDIACYPEKEQEIFEQTNRDNKSSIALKFLIEYIAAVPPKGNIDIGENQYERLMAICSLIIDWSYKNDLFYYQIFNTPIEILKSHRIGMKQQEFQHMFSVNEAIRKEQLIASSVLDNSGDLIEYKSFGEEINAAFEKEYGYSFYQLKLFTEGLREYSKRQSGDTVYVARIMDIIEFMSAYNASFNEEVVGLIIDSIALRQREDFLVPPEPFRKEDVYPWRFNRELSFTRRPIIIRGDEMIWGNRQLDHMIRFTLGLINNGKLKAHSSKMNSLVGRISDERGAEFNDFIYKILVNFNVFEVYPNISKVNGVYIAENNNTLGDIDVLIIDREYHKIIAAEVKNFNFSKNPYEMHLESKKMFENTKKKKGYYTKHCRRVDWCNKHIDDFKKQYGLDDSDWRVIGVFILSQSLVSTEIYHKEIKMLTEKELSVSSIRNIY